jgi:hypothetical protein
VHIKTVHDMETEIGMDGRLDRLKAHVLQIFPLSERSLSAEFRPKVSPLLRRPASVSAAVKAEDPYEFESIHLVK